ncbi:uncharacterized protein LOC112592261 [Melanaphis sacchari]|uniref:uncharacterized protein LOC112592261 n=1 Tax=Melanaphis sacchari TaxID=742174 RepID=UPI000DC146D7|nr:uncharacterized protein LOC112592261 [Melanaphis sacchari]
MISYKVLIILFFTINMSYCYSKEEIQKECKICVDNLRLLGFRYKKPLINYSLAMQYATYANVISFETIVRLNLTQNEIYQQEQEYGKSVLSAYRISYVYAYYNECIFFDFDLNAFLLSPREFCKLQSLSGLGCLHYPSYFKPTHNRHRHTITYNVVSPVFKI